MAKRTSPITRANLGHQFLCSLTAWTLAWISAWNVSSHDLSSFAADTPKQLTQEERDSIEQHYKELRAAIARLQLAPDAPPTSIDRWADVDLFRRAARWALDYDDTFTDRDREAIKKVLDEGLSRSRAFADGPLPWMSKSGKVIRGFRSNVDNSTQPYGVIIPATYHPDRPIPLHVVLHGSMRPVGMVETRFIQRFLSDDPASEVDYIEMHPLGRVENCYRWSGETDVFEAIAAVCRQYNIDRERIVLRGMSMGASGTWHLGLKHPGWFVALGPYCGYVDTRRFSRTPNLSNFIVVDELPDYQDRALHMLDSVDYAANASMIPAIAAMGEKDIFFDAHVIMGEAFASEGLTLNNLISPGTGHVIDPKVHAEQLSQIKAHVERGLDRSPQHLRFVTWTLKYNRCHWLELLKLDRHYERAEFIADLPGDDQNNELTVTNARNISRFAIDTSHLSRAIESISIEDQLITVKSAPRIILTRDEGKWRQLAEDDPLLRQGKRPGVQGPIDDAFVSRFICVRGTGTCWHPATRAWTDSRLQHFIDTWRKYFRGDLIVKNDVDLTDDDLRNAHLILFGDPASNSWIAKSLPHTPLTWTKDKIQLGEYSVAAAEHIPVLIQPSPFDPEGKHYIVYNTGHSFGAAELAAVNYLLFPRLGDWAILKSDLSLVEKADAQVFFDPAVVHCGFFDEHWKLSSP